MKRNIKFSVASLALLIALGANVGHVSADVGVMTTQSTNQTATSMSSNQQLLVLLKDINLFLVNVQSYVENMEESDPMDPNTSTPAADLRVTMNNLFSEHVDVSAEVMRNIIDDSADLGASKEAQMNNAVEIAEAFGGLYGSEVEEAVADAFVEHIEFSNEYAEAVDDMDEDAKEAADEELDEYLNDIAELLASVIDTVDQETVYSVLRDHETS